MSKTEKNNIARKALIEAKRLKKGSEELITQQIVESLSPQIKNQISKMVSEMDDFDEDDDYVEEGKDEVEDETDFESDFSDEEEGEEYVEEGDDEEYEEDYSEEESGSKEEVDDEDEEFIEETIDDAEVEDFINQLESYLKEEEQAGDEEDIEADDLDVEDIDEDEDRDGEVPTDEDDDDEDYIKELEDWLRLDGIDEGSDGKDSKYKMKYESLKKDFSDMYKILKETSLDVERSRIYQEIATAKKITESKKLSLMKALDNASSSKELKRVQESFNLAWDNKSTKKRKPVSESKTRGRRGSFSKGVKTSMKNKGKKKKIDESKHIIAPDAVAKLAEWADIK